MKKGQYRNTPRGCGNLSKNTPKTGGAFVDLDELIATGSRANRRFAMRELRKLKSKSGC